MKRLSAKQRLRCIRKAVWGNAPRRRDRKRARQVFVDNPARRAFDAARKALPVVPERVNPQERLYITDAPKHFSFLENYEETLAFVLALRQLQTQKLGGLNKNISRRSQRLINLARIEDLDPAAGLVLAAELDIYKPHARNMRSLDESWHENVRSFFFDAGLFELIGLPPQKAHAKEAAGPVVNVLKYRKGMLPDGAQADELRTALEHLCGEKFGPKIAVNGALCEAMTNSKHHAYPDDIQWWPKRPSGHWWATGAWTPSNSTMHMMLYDQGVGIPATLPRSDHWASALPLLDRLDPERTDAGLIEAALELRRTSTNIRGRGRGLHEMADWIDKTEAGFLRIWSGKGRVTYRPGHVVEKKNLSTPFCGTLVEWEVRHEA